VPDKQQLKAWIWDWVNTLVFALALALFIRAFFIQVFWIPSGSMIPTLDINDRILVNKLAYGLPNPLFESYKEKTFLYIIPNPLYKKPVITSGRQYLIDFKKNPKRFDIAVFRLYDADDNRKDLIKRVLGLPGEKLELKRGVVYINGQELKEGHKMNRDNVDFGPINIPPGMYFMMGDNRGNSADSRYWGFLPRGQVIGPAIFRIWPLYKLGLF